MVPGTALARNIVCVWHSHQSLNGDDFTEPERYCVRRFIRVITSLMYLGCIMNEYVRTKQKDSCLSLDEPYTAVRRMTINTNIRRPIISKIRIQDWPYIKRVHSGRTSGRLCPKIRGNIRKKEKTGRKAGRKARYTHCCFCCCTRKIKKQRETLRTQGWVILRSNPLSRSK